MKQLIKNKAIAIVLLFVCVSIACAYSISVGIKPGADYSFQATWWEFMDESHLRFVASFDAEDEQAVCMYYYEARWYNSSHVEVSRTEGWRVVDGAGGNLVNGTSDRDDPLPAPQGNFSYSYVIYRYKCDAQVQSLTGQVLATDTIHQANAFKRDSSGAFVDIVSWPG